MSDMGSEEVQEVRTSCPLAMYITDALLCRVHHRKDEEEDEVREENEAKAIPRSQMARCSMPQTTTKTIHLW